MDAVTGAIGTVTGLVGGAVGTVVGLLPPLPSVITSLWGDTPTDVLLKEWLRVEVHEPDWWIARFTAAGFVHSPDLTKRIHEAAQGGRNEKSTDGKISYRAQHIWLNMQVFLNPPVLRLQKHAHLWGEPGCFGMKIGKQQQLGRWCGHHGTIGSGVTQADRLPKQWMPLPKAFKSDAEVGWEPPPCGCKFCGCPRPDTHPGCC